MRRIKLTVIEYRCTESACLCLCVWGGGITAPQKHWISSSLLKRKPLAGGDITGGDVLFDFVVNALDSVGSLDSSLVRRLPSYTVRMCIGLRRCALAHAFCGTATQRITNDNNLHNALLPPTALMRTRRTHSRTFWSRACSRASAWEVG